MTKEELVKLLKNYTAKKKQIEQLKFELSHLPHISENEIINSLTLGSSLSRLGTINVSHVSDRTMAIAMHYKDTGAKLIDEAASQILQELNILSEEVERLEHYLSLLRDTSSMIIRLFYFEEKLWKEISDELKISERNLLKQRDVAIDELLAMYQYLTRIKTDKGKHSATF